MVIYKDIELLYIDLIKYNEENIIFTGEHNIPISNKYYVFIIDPNNTTFNNYYNKLLDVEENEDILYNKIRVNLDEDQVFRYDILKNNYKEVDKIFSLIYNNSNDDNGEVCLILDIGFIINFIKFIEENTEIENHILDFIIYKLRNRVDKIFIYDEKNILQKNSLLYYEFLTCYKQKIDISNLKFYTIKNDDKDYLENNYVTLYKNKNNLYWKILDCDSRINYNEDFSEDHDYENKIITVDIDNIESFITLSEIDDEMLLGNIFTKENMVKVLHPLTKNTIFYE
jgi:hypothetical protein